MDKNNKIKTMIKKLGEGFPLPSEFDIENYYEKGVIRKEDLIDGKYYLGICRNAEVAKWDAEKNVFSYLRQKFNLKYFEEINHISDDDGYDLFIPIEEIK